MSQGPENTFIGSVHRHLPKELYVIKNHNSFNSGQPDCWYSGPAGDLWVEYKFVVIPKRGDTLVPINLSELQKNWIRARHAEGRKLAVVVGCKDGGVWFDGVSWDHEISAEKFRHKLLDRKAIAATIAVFLK